MTTTLSPLAALTRAIEKAPRGHGPQRLAEAVVIDLAAAGYRITPGEEQLPEAIRLVTNAVADFNRQASNAARDSVEQLVARDVADVLLDVAIHLAQRGPA